MPMKIKRWAILTVFLYGLMLCALTVPLLLAYSFDENWPDKDSQKELLEIYKEPAYWIFIATLTFFEALALLAPIDVTRERPFRRGPWVTLAVVAAFLMGILICTIGLVVAATMDNGDDNVLIFCFLLGVCGWLFWAIIFWNYTASRNPTSILKRILDRLMLGSTAELLV